MTRRTVLVVVGLLSTVTPSVVLSAATAAPQAANAVSIVHPPLSALTSTRNDSVTSTNWSGYAVSAASPFTGVLGTWVQPTATCSSGFLAGSTYSSFWVGLDGYTSSSVEQLGTDSDCSRGTPTYYAWYEMYPANSVQLSSSTYPVKPGDTLSASVTRNGTSYTLAMTDTENGANRWTFSQPETGTEANSSAEWVAEAPEICTFIFCRLANLTNFGTVTFSGSVAATGGANQPISSFTASGGPHEMTMVSSNGTVKAQPSPLNSGGNGFSDTWKHT